MKSNLINIEDDGSRKQLPLDRYYTCATPYPNPLPTSHQGLHIAITAIRVWIPSWSLAGFPASHNTSRTHPALEALAGQMFLVKKSSNVIGAQCNRIIRPLKALQRTPSAAHDKLQFTANLPFGDMAECISGGPNHAWSASLNGGCW
jgi:hypothetical protein